MYELIERGDSGAIEGGTSNLNVVLVNTISPYYLVRQQSPFAVNTLAEYLERAVPDLSVQRIDMQAAFDMISARPDAYVTTCVDETILRTANRVCEIAKTGQTVLGLSMKWATIDVVKKIVEKVQRECADKVLYVIGNIGSTFGYKELLKMDFLKNSVAVVGEGEEALVSIVNLALGDRKNMVNPGLYKNIPNVAVNITGEPFLAGTARVDLDAYPSLLIRDVSEIYDKEKNCYNFETSRGCPWGKCTFCSVNSQFGNTNGKEKNWEWRAFPVDMVLENIQSFVDKGVRALDFKDSEFFGPVRQTNGDDPFFKTTSRAREIIEGIQKINDKLPAGDKLKIGHISSRTDTVYRNNEPEKNDIRKETYRRLKEAGIQSVYLGVESGSPSQLRRFGKGVAVKENEKALEILRELGFELEVGFIFFDFLATMQELKENIEFIERTKLFEMDSRIFGCLRVQEGSKYVSLAKKKGLLRGKTEDQLSYYCRFQNNNVADLHSIFAYWESATVKLARVVPLDARKEIYKMNFLFIKELVFDFVDNSGKNKPVILEKYHSMRRNFLAEIRSKSNLWSLGPEIEKLFKEYLLRAEKLNEGEDVLDGDGAGIGETIRSRAVPVDNKMKIVL